VHPIYHRYVKVKEEEMRKLLIAMLALSTLAWAHGGKKTDNQSRAGSDWYQATLNSQVDQSVRLNQTVSPAATAFAERGPAPSGTPPAMAGRAGAQDDFYNQKIQIQSEVNRRDLNALKKAP